MPKDRKDLFRHAPPENASPQHFLESYKGCTLGGWRRERKKYELKKKKQKINRRRRWDPGHRVSSLGKTWREMQVDSGPVGSQHCKGR